MSSTNSPTVSLPKLSDPDTASAMFEAVRSVAEHSFFAVAEPGDERSFAAQAAAVPSWLVATVRFEQGALQGTVACTMPTSLARGLFDAFAGRDPSEPEPGAELVHDLVGEFSNMVCGAWLTRVASTRTFTLHHPTVEPLSSPRDASGPRLLAVIDDVPVAVEVTLTADPQAAPQRH
jgi:CheY-specific phosphatase CheX